MVTIDLIYQTIMFVEQYSLVLTKIRNFYTKTQHEAVTKTESNPKSLVPAVMK